ncbi:MAG: hypothetical protein SF029_09765 [bacterium]|nr:hypothetical protein [bacterium]
MYDRNLIEAHTRTRQQDLTRESEMARLAESAQGSHDRQPFYAPALAKMGAMMVEMGSHLQERYGEICEDVAGVRAELGAEASATQETRALPAR